MFTIFGFYKFKKIRLLKRYKSLFQEEISKNNIKGTIILSTEGINGSIAGEKNNINKMIKTLKKKLDLMFLIVKISLKVVFSHSIKVR